VSLFLELHLAFIFHLDFCSDLVISFVKKGLNGVGKEKKSFMQKVVQKGACLDCGLDFCMRYLMSF
jgi:hypothetical protein